MSRYPFRAAANAYLTEYRHVFARSTYEERERALRRMTSVMEDLCAAGTISTTDPAKMTYSDVKEYFAVMKARGLSSNSMAHEMAYLNSLCKFCGNNCVDMARSRYPMIRRTETRKRGPTIPYDVIGKVILTGMRREGFERLRGYAAVVISLSAGLRADEIRNAKRDNLCLEDGTIYVDIVKGRGTYGEPRTIPIHPEALELIGRYVRIRDLTIGRNSDYLFCCRSHPGPLATNTLRKDKAIVSGEVGYDGATFQACRRTYGQWLKDEGVPMEALSLHMGHKNSRTTETFYARQRESDALAITKQVWKERNEKMVTED